MNSIQGLIGTIAVTASIAGVGCASQSDAFRRMSAADHERAATSSTDAALAQEHLDAANRLRSEERVACEGEEGKALHGRLTSNQKSATRKASEDDSPTICSRAPASVTLRLFPITDR